MPEDPDELDWQERAAIIEYDGNMDRATAEIRATEMELRRRKHERDATDTGEGGSG
jgi:hypothetical protein